MKKVGTKGWVYVITTATHDYVKIGYTDRDPQKRALELDGTSSPHPHIVEYAVLVENPRDLEQKVHQQLAVSRVSKEWFDLSFMDAIEEIKEIGKSQILFEDISERVIRINQARNISRSNLPGASSQVTRIASESQKKLASLSGLVVAPSENKSEGGCLFLIIIIATLPFTWVYIITFHFTKNPKLSWVLGFLWIAYSIGYWLVI